MNFLSVLAALALANLARAGPCNADNCARAVTGTMRQLTSTHRADCASYMACTVTPAAVTAISTVTVTVSPPASTVTAAVFDKKVKKSVSPLTNTTAIAGAITNCPSAVPTYASACSGTVRYSSACSCWGLTRSTVTATAATSTVTATVTSVLPASVVTISPTPPALCGNAGLQWAYFFDGQPDFDSEQSAAFDPTEIKTFSPELTGVTNYLHYSDREGNVYGVGASNDFFTLEHRGYLFAPESGTYNFAVTNLDNNWDFWIGARAYSGWTKANAQQDAFLNDDNFNGQVAAATYIMTLTAGTFYPIRGVYHNDRGPGTFDFVITAPSGKVIIGSDASTAKNSPFVVQYSCDRTLAPPFQPFGQET